MRARTVRRGGWGRARCERGRVGDGWWRGEGVRSTGAGESGDGVPIAGGPCVRTKFFST
ncbi:MAG: hypothetical protein ABGY24_02385 [bacterium]